MSVGMVQNQNAISNGSGTSLTSGSSSWNFNINAGGTIIVAIWANAGSNVSITSVTDDQGNTYVADVVLNNIAKPVAIYRASNVIGGTKPQITVNASATCSMGFFAYEFSGVSHTSPLDTSATAAGSGNTALNGAITTTLADEIAVTVLNVGTVVETPASIDNGFSMILFRTTDPVGGSGYKALTATLSSVQVGWAIANTAFWTVAIGTWKGITGVTNIPKPVTLALPDRRNKRWRE